MSLISDLESLLALVERNAKQASERSEVIARLDGNNPSEIPILGAGISDLAADAASAWKAFGALVRSLLGTEIIRFTQDSARLLDQAGNQIDRLRNELEFARARYEMRIEAQAELIAKKTAELDELYAERDNLRDKLAGERRRMREIEDDLQRRDLEFCETCGIDLILSRGQHNPGFSCSGKDPKGTA